jgi:hypothetical protein
VDNQIKKFSVWKYVTETIFFMRVADGEKQSTILMHYKKKLKNVRLLSKVKTASLFCGTQTEEEYLLKTCFQPYRNL